MYFNFELGNYESLYDLFEDMYGTILFHYAELEFAKDEAEEFELVLWGFYKKNNEMVCYTYSTTELQPEHFYQDQLIHLLIK